MASMQTLRKGLFGPVGFIVLVQAVVLVASLLAASSLMSPFIGNNFDYPQLAHNHGSDVEQADLGQAASGQSIFRIKEAINNDSNEDFFSRDSFGSLSNREVQYVIQRGDNLASLWLNNGAPALGATRAIDSMKVAGIPNPVIRKGDIFNLTLSSSGDLINISRRAKDGSTLVLKGSSTEGYEASVIKPNIVEEERSVSGAIFNSFFSAATNSGIPLETVDDVVDLFGNRIEFSKAIQPGDSYTITFLEKRCKDTGQVLDVGPVVSASFKTRGKLFAAIRYKDSSGKFVYFDEKGERGGDFFLRYPLKFSRISSTFAWARFHPVLKKSRPHKGVDFAAPAGTPIRTVGDGVVLSAAYNGAGGNTIKIRHSDRWTTVYMHMQKFASGIRAGQKISRGDLIGYVGSTGMSTGAHLHFELWDNGKYIDPLAADLPNISVGEKGLPAGFLTATLKDMESRHQQVQVALLSKDSKPNA